jgi:hypothetical protein
MSTANAPADIQTSREAVLSEQGQSELTKPKFTAAQIQEDCPARLQQIAREITERQKKAQKQAELAADHLIAIEKLLAEAKELCDGGGFYKFRELYCPKLGRSQAYVLHAIAGGKKTLVEHRTAERERKQRARANQRAAAAKSGTVPDNLKRPEAHTDASSPEPTSTAEELTPEPKKPRSAVAPGDEALPFFTARVMELDRTTHKRPPERFSATAVPVEVLARLGCLLIDIANFKKSETVKPAPSAGGGLTSVEPSAEDLRIDDELDARVSARLET